MSDLGRDPAITGTGLGAAGGGYLDWPDEPITDLRWVVLHMIEETARHAGHLDAVRELLDGDNRPRPSIAPVSVVLPSAPADTRRPVERRDDTLG